MFCTKGCLIETYRMKFQNKVIFFLLLFWILTQNIKWAPLKLKSSKSRSVSIKVHLNNNTFTIYKEPIPTVLDKAMKEPWALVHCRLKWLWTGGATQAGQWLQENTQHCSLGDPVTVPFAVWLAAHLTWPMTIYEVTSCPVKRFERLVGSQLRKWLGWLGALGSRGTELFL